MKKGLKEFLLLIVIQLLLYTKMYSAATGTEDMSIGAGHCPTYPGMQNFSSSLFQGRWFVGHQFQFKWSSCRIFDLTSLSERRMKVKSTIPMNRRGGLIIEAESLTPNVTNPAFMKWDSGWNGGMINLNDEVTVIDTDYESYSAIILCNDLGLFHMKYGIMLSRNMDPPLSDLSKAAEILSPFITAEAGPKRQRCGFDEKYMEHVSESENNVAVHEALKSLMTFVNVLA